MKSIIQSLGFLLVLIIVATSLSSVQHTKEVRKTMSLESNGKLTIDTYKGTISIETWNKPEVDMVATIEPDGWDRGDVEKVEDTEIRIDSSSDRVRIRTDYDHLRSHSHFFFGLFGDNSENLPFVHYSIKMPSTAQLRIKDYKSDTKVSGLAAAMDIETYKGTLEIRDVKGPVDLDTYKGEAKIYFAKYVGTNRMKTYKGRIDLRLPSDASFDLDADLGRRADLETDFDHVGRTVHHGTARYSGAENGGSNILHLESEKGRFSLMKR